MQSLDIFVNFPIYDINIKRSTPRSVDSTAIALYNE